MGGGRWALGGCEPRPAILASSRTTLHCGTSRFALERRYGVDYAILCTSSRARAEAALDECRAARQPVAVVISDRWRTSEDATPLLRLAGELHPIAKRVSAADVHSAPW